MANSEFEKELEKESQGHLVRMCEGKGLPHTGDKDALIARLVAYEEAKGTEPETQGTEPETQGTEPEPEPGAEPEPESQPEPQPED